MDNFSESFNRTKLLINYDVSKTLSENEEIRTDKCFINLKNLNELLHS
jgi:hypothetical protein